MGEADFWQAVVLAQIKLGQHPRVARRYANEVIENYWALFFDRDDLLEPSRARLKKFESEHG